MDKFREYWNKPSTYSVFVYCSGYDFVAAL